MFIIENKNVKEVTFKDIPNKGAFLYCGDLYAKGGMNISTSKESYNAYEFVTGRFIHMSENDFVTPVKVKITIENIDSK
jgi:hypothetical protein